MQKYKCSMPKFFPISVSIVLTGVPCFYSIFCSTNWKAKAAIMTLSCFSLYFLGLLSFFFLTFCRGRGGGVFREFKLDEGGWVLGGLDIEDGDAPIRKKMNVSKSVIANLAIRIMYGVISNKPLNQRYLKK